MRTLLAVVAAAAAVFHTGASAPQPHTVYQGGGGRIEAFAQDGNLLSWFAAGTRTCNSVWLYSLVDGLLQRLPLQGQSHPNVTCTGPAGPPLRLALAGANALWTLREPGVFPFDYLLGAGIRDRRERRFQEIAHDNRGRGLWLGSISGDHTTLVYAVTAVNYVDEVSCLANPKAKRACTLERTGGGVYRLAGRTAPQLVRGT